MIICDNDLEVSTFYNNFFFLKKTAEAHICFVNLMHRSAWWLQSKNMLDTSVHDLYLKNSHILGWFPLLISLFSLLLVFILKNIASLFNKVGYFKDFKIVIHICRWQLQFTLSIVYCLVMLSAEVEENISVHIKLIVSMNSLGCKSK